MMTVATLSYEYMMHDCCTIHMKIIGCKEGHICPPSVSPCCTMGVFIYMGEALSHLGELKECMYIRRSVERFYSSTVQPSTLSMSVKLLTCISDVLVSVLVGRTSVLDVFSVTSML